MSDEALLRSPAVEHDPDPRDFGHRVRLVPDGLAYDALAYLAQAFGPQAFSSFDELRVAAPHTLFDSTSTYDLNPTEWGSDLVTGGTATYNTTTGMTPVLVTGASGSRARIRTHTYFRYQAGKGQRIRVTGRTTDGGQANQVRRWGYFEDSDGVFFEQSGSTLRAVVRSSISGSPVDDATTITGVDPTINAVWEMSFRYLGVGPVRFWRDGQLLLTKSFSAATPFMRTSDLPVQIEAINTGASSAGGFHFKCANVYSEGGDDYPGYAFHAQNNVDIVVTPSATLPLVAIRPKLTFKGRANRRIIIPSSMTASTEGQNARMFILWNPTLTGGTWVDVDANASAVEYNITATAVSGGVVLAAIFIRDQTSFTFANPGTFSLPGRKMRRDAFASSTDMLVIAGRNEKAGNTNMQAGGAWVEI